LHKKDLYEYTDEALVKHFVETHQNDALGLLFERYRHLVFGVCFKYLGERASAEDACMFVFEKLTQSLQGQQIIVFKAWLYTVAKNHCLVQLRSQKTKPVTYVEDFNFLLMEKEPDTHLAIEKEIKLQKMDAALAILDNKQSVCLRKFYLDNHSYAQIQEQTGFTFGEVKSYIQNGKRNLKVILDKQIDAS
jgi:RNA polymerase sigma factor (sigma-70 family)